MTGKPTRDLVRHRLQQYSEVGVRQFLIYPRSGCEISYMSDQWLEACRNVVECAEELGMDVWLYDEFNWPSGRCDGEVMQGHPEFCAKTLSGTKTKEGMTWEVTSIPEHADLLSPAAMRRFMALTHKRYEEHLSAYFGRRIKGIFTDEPSFKYGRPQTGDGTRLKLPYYDGIEEDYTKATGRNLRDDLSRAMHGEEVEGLWPAFYGLLGKQFQTAFFTPIREWCDRHGMVSTGHLMSEVPPVSSVNASGTPMACLRGLSLPGIDEISTRVTFDRAEWGTLLLERNADGRVCLLNLTDQDLVGLKLQTPSSKVRFDLPARGVRVFDPAAETRDDVAARRESAPEPRFRVRLDRPNLLRCRMKPVPDTDSHGFAFECDKMVSARLVVRAPGQLQSVCLDGKNVALPDACTDLPEGMREFYKVSGDLTLAPGKHRVELAGEVDDAPFLPVAFLAGDFGLSEGDVLRPLAPTAGCEDLRACGLRNYAGRVTLKTTLSVPDQSGEISLRLDTGEHIAEVVVDGRSLGTRGWAPFEWEIPTEFRGKPVSLEITLTPSIGAMFDRPDTIDGGPRWLKDFWPGDHAPFGVLSAPVWCIRERLR